MTSTQTNGSPNGYTPTYVYIAGRGHSGSTLLTMLLARHPRIAAVGELSLLPLQLARDETTRWVGRCSCGERPLNCAVWGRLLDEIASEEGVDFRDDPFAWRVSDVGMEEEFRASAPIRAPISWLRNRIWRLTRFWQYMAPDDAGKLFSKYKPQIQWASRRSKLASKLAALHDADAIVDASKDPLDMLDLYYHATVPVRVVFLTRDARGNAWSMLKRLKNGQSRAEAIRPAAMEWNKVNGRIWRLFQRIDPQYRLHLRYEDLCREPVANMNRLFEFVGLEPVDVVSGAGESGRKSDPPHTIGGNKIRFTGERLEILEDTAWKSNLTDDELSTINLVTGSLSHELGYER